MAPRSEEEKDRRKAEFEARKKARQEAKAKKEKEEAEKKAALEKLKNLKIDSDEDDSKDKFCYILTLAEDAQNQIYSFCSARDLGCISMTCRSVNFGMGEARIYHILSRLNSQARVDEVGKLMVPIQFAKNEKECRRLLESALMGSGETGRLVTKKMKKSSEGDADEYIGFARFLEEALLGYSTQKVPGQKPALLPPMVNGRFASVSPEHSLCRLGGDGLTTGAGGSGCAAWGVGKRGQLGNGKRKDEQHPKRLLGLGYGGSRIVQVSAGGGLVRVAHSLLLTSTGQVLSFGTAQYGQLGHGYSAGKQLPDVLRPQVVEGLKHLRCICVSAGELHSAVVTEDGDLMVWGDGFCGQLGLGDKRPQLEPVLVEKGGLEDECVLTVSCGARHTLAVTEEGEVWSFGLGHFGVLGRSFTPYEYFNNSAVAGLGVDDEEIQVEVAVEHQDPLQYIEHMDDEIRQQLDLLTNLTLDDGSDQCIPKVIEALQGIKIIGACAGHRHSIFLDAEGNVYTCGDGSGGALGHDDTSRQDFPMKVMYFEEKNIKIMQISAGVDMSMAVSTTGEVYGWGNAVGGRIGVINKDYTKDYVTRPHKVNVIGGNGESKQAVDVECGYVHSMIVCVDGTVFMCGDVDTDELDAVDNKLVPLTPGSHREPKQIPDFNIWHRLPEPKEQKKQTKWKKYGKYELKGRSAMYAQRD